MDEMWSFYHDKSHQVWLWRAVEHGTNTPLAYVFGTREHKYLDKLLTLLKPFPVGTVYADGNYAYRDKIAAENLKAAASWGLLSIRADFTGLPS